MQKIPKNKFVGETYRYELTVFESTMVAQLDFRNESGFVGLGVSLFDHLARIYRVLAGTDFLVSLLALRA